MKRQNRHVLTRSERLKATAIRGVFVFLLINLIATPRLLGISSDDPGNGKSLHS